MTVTPVTDRDWSKPMWGAIGTYIASIVVWVITCLALIRMHLEDPIRLVAMNWGISYLPTLLAGLVCALLARACGAWRLYIHSLLIPLYATLLTVVAATCIQIEKHQERITFWADPPTRISELKIGTAFEGATEAAAFTNVFFIPDGVTKSDIVQWDGERLIFKTMMSSQAVKDFYFYAYDDILDFHLISLGGSAEYDDYNYEINKDAHLRLIVGDDKKQPFTQVGIVSCRDIVDCWHFEWGE